VIQGIYLSYEVPIRLKEGIAEKGRGYGSRGHVVDTDDERIEKSS
jgi:hypothetical protein